MGRGTACSTLSDEYTRECRAIKFARKLNSMDVIETLADLFLLRGVPAHIRSDQGPEFIAEAVTSWIGAVGAQTAYIERGSPWENGYVESFNGRLPRLGFPQEAEARRRPSCDAELSRLPVFRHARQRHLQHLRAVDDGRMRHENLKACSAQQSERATSGLAMPNLQESGDELCTVVPAGKRNGTRIGEVLAAA